MPLLNRSHETKRRIWEIGSEWQEQYKPRSRAAALLEKWQSFRVWLMGTQGPRAQPERSCILRQFLVLK